MFRPCPSQRPIQTPWKAAATVDVRIPNAEPRRNHQLLTVHMQRHIAAETLPQFPTSTTEQRERFCIAGHRSIPSYLPSLCAKGLDQNLQCPDSRIPRTGLHAIAVMAKSCAARDRRAKALASVVYGQMPLVFLAHARSEHRHPLTRKNNHQSPSPKLHLRLRPRLNPYRLTSGMK